MKGQKYIEMANFNCTFGKENKPMLDYFLEILYPALNSNMRRVGRNGNEYLIEDVKVYDVEGLGLVLIGLHIMRTKIEVKSLYMEGKGIQPTDRKYKSDPYSAFAIILKNHRMIYIKNQKGSPPLKAFGRSMMEIINEYVREQNKMRDKANKLPYAYINITNIPSLQSIDKQFKQIEKIKKVTFKLYPLNGDMEVNNIFDSFRNELSHLGSKTGNMNINTPKNKKEVSKMVKEAGDKVDTILYTVLNDGTEKKFKNNDFSEKIPVYLPEEEEDIHKNIMYAIDKVSGKDVLRNVSEENEKKYKRIYKRVLDFIVNNGI